MLAREHRLLLDSLLFGVVGALAAQAFTVLLRLCERIFLRGVAGYIPPGLPAEGGVLLEQVGSYGLWLIPLSTTLGGLVSGMLVYTFAPEAEGHGTDTVVKAFHHAGGFIRARVAPLKMLASAITIGSGGAAGREGPTALVSAGIGSVYATLLRRSEEERRLLVLIGMAAGLSAIFRSPIGTAIFAVEVLYGGMEFEAGALAYTMLAAVVAYAINGVFVGWTPLFRVPVGLTVMKLSDYSEYALLGVAAGAAATALPLVFYGLRDGFLRMPVPATLRPAIGGLALGLLALTVPQVLGGGYGWIQEAIDGRLPLYLLGWLMVAKTLAFGFTVSSGGSGGVFAPGLCVGAMLGGGMAAILDQPSAAFVVVGMAAVFGAAARTPIATLLMVTEMTGGYWLLVPAALAVMVSFFVQATLSRRLRYPSLYEAQVETRSDSPAHHVEHLKSALHLMGEGYPHLQEVGHLPLLLLLQSGIPVDLPDGRQLHIVEVTSTSPQSGKSLRGSSLFGSQEALPLLVVLRDKRVLLPHSDVTIRTGDRMLLLASPGEWERFRPLLSGPIDGARSS